MAVGAVADEGADEGGAVCWLDGAVSLYFFLAAGVWDLRRRVERRRRNRLRLLRRRWTSRRWLGLREGSRTWVCRLLLWELWTPLFWICFDYCKC